MATINVNDLVFSEKNGDITFYKHIKKDKLYQQIGKGEIFPVKDGVISYKFVDYVVNQKKTKKWSIKYNTNGAYGFCIFDGNKCLEDGFWTLSHVKESAYMMF